MGGCRGVGVWYGGLWGVGVRPPAQTALCVSAAVPPLKRHSAFHKNPPQMKHSYLLSLTAGTLCPPTQTRLSVFGKSSPAETFRSAALVQRR